jgi:putative DNA primase/helicase
MRTAGVEFVQRLIEQGAGLSTILLKRVRELSREFAPLGCDPEVSRVADFFALVAVAGEMASEYEITGWLQGESTNAALTCFSAWLEQRGTHGSREEIEALRQVRITIQRYGDRFDWLRRASKADDHKPNNLDRIGFKRPVNAKGEEIAPVDGSVLGSGDAWAFEYLIQRESFVEHFCKGREFEFVARLLRDRGYTKVDKGKLTSKQRIPGAGVGAVSCIVIRGDQLFADSEDRSNGEASDCDERGEAMLM